MAPNRADPGGKMLDLAKVTPEDYVIDLGYETTPDQLRYVLMELRTLLYSDARVANDPALWVRFKEFGAYSLKVEVSAWVQAKDAQKYREIAEDLNFKMLKYGVKCSFQFLLLRNSWKSFRWVKAVSRVSSESCFLRISRSISTSSCLISIWAISLLLSAFRVVPPVCHPDVPLLAGCGRTRAEEDRLRHVRISSPG
jgi:hypothetical protein